MVPESVSPAKLHRLLRPPWSDLVIIAACVLSLTLYIAMSWSQMGGPGYPLDDAWIYQTYARNLAHHGQWAFIAGVPSTGSTSLLWTPLLVPGYLLPIHPFWWTQLAGLGALMAAALGAARLAEGGPTPAPLVSGLAVAGAWQVVWAAASGMETALFAALILWFWVWFTRHKPAAGAARSRDGLLLGLWCGVLMLARPEGVLAAGVAGLYGVLVLRSEWKRLVRWGLMAALGFALILVPFFAMNYAISGAWWPNTFYAKQTEYAALYELPYILRLFQQAGVSMVGAQILLIPGLVILLWRGIKEADKALVVLPLAWVGLHWMLYAARLPVIYQHGRYAIPTVPVILVLGINGMFTLIQPAAQRFITRVASLGWPLAFAASHLAVLIVLGAPAYVADTAFIEDEMVATARWIEANTSSTDVVAAHDIGALGYFAPRPLIDLAGLVSPAVIPIMHDPSALALFIEARGADYLVIFPNWSDAYRMLASDPMFCPVWDASQEAGYVMRSGLGPMTVYSLCSTP